MLLQNECMKIRSYVYIAIHREIRAYSYAYLLATPERKYGYGC